MDWYMVCVLNAGMLGAVLATGMSPIFGVAICPDAKARVSHREAPHF